MWLLDSHYPLLTTVRHWPVVAGGLLILVGVLIDLLSIVQFRRAKTTVNPMRPESSSSLVTTGLYAYSRNPMYVGLLVCLTGVVLILRSLTPLLILPLFVIVVTLFQIVPEQRAIASIFGDEFEYYKKKVPRWLQ